MLYSNLAFRFYTLLSFHVLLEFLSMQMYFFEKFKPIIY